MKNNSSYNNNALCLTQSRFIQNDDDDTFSHSEYNSQTLNIIRSIVDELYQINKEEILSRNDSNEKRVRFTLEEETYRTESITLNDSKSTEITVKSQPILSNSSAIICCLIKGQSKIDCSLSTNDFPSLQCECATQTMDITKSTSILNHSLYSCENSNILSSSSTAHQLIVPSEGKCYDICQEQIIEYDSIFSDDHMNDFNSSIHSENLTKLNDQHSLSKSDENLSDKTITETNTRICTCSNRKLSDNHFSKNKFTLSDQGRLLEELHLSPQTLQSMHNDGLFYIHDLPSINLFLNNRYTCLYRSTNNCNEYDAYHSYSSSIYNPTYYTDKLACIKAELACTSVMVGTINVIFITVAYISNQPQIPPPSTGQHFVECYNCHTRIQIV